MGLFKSFPQSCFEPGFEEILRPNPDSDWVQIGIPKYYWLAILKYYFMPLCASQFNNFSLASWQQSHNAIFHWNFSKSLMCYHWLSVSGNFKIMHCRICIDMPYSANLIYIANNSSCFLFNQEKTTQNTSFFIQNNDCRL